MTDKQIIIHEVDVSRCMFFNKEYNEDDVKIKDCCELQFISCRAFDCASCYYKRWQRAETQLAKDEEIQVDMRLKIDELNGLLKAKEQECEELKNKLKKITEWRHNYCMNCEDLLKPSHSCKGCYMTTLRALIEE